MCWRSLGAVSGSYCPVLLACESYGETGSDIQLAGLAGAAIEQIANHNATRLFAHST